MAYVRDIKEVRKVTQTSDINEVNDKVKDGWMLLQIVTPDSRKPETKIFSLGKFSI